MRLGVKARILTGAGLLLALLFLLLGVRDLRRDASAAAPPTTRAQPTAPVAILAAAARPIRIGETIAADMIRNAPADPRSHPTIASAAELVGKVATRPLAAGALIPRDAVGGEAKLAIRVPVGMRAISIDTTAEIAVAGLVRPGDRVDVQVVYPGADAISGARGAGRSRAQTLLQMAQVLAVGEAVVGASAERGALGEPSAPPPPARTVTLALTPDQVSALALAKSTGALTLSLRNPTDGEQLALAPALSRAPDPAPTAVAPAAPPPPPARPGKVPSRPHAIELVVGDRHEILYSGRDPR